MNGSGWAFPKPKRTPGRGPAGKVPALLLGKREAAQALGISERTLWALTKEGKVPYVRLRRRVLYDPGDLQAWVHGLKRPRYCPPRGRRRRPPS